MKKRPNKQQRAYYSMVVEGGCIICEMPAEIHHTKVNQGMGQRDHNSVLPLCPWHHRTGGHGVAFHAGKVTWQEFHGTEVELLAKLQSRL